MEYRKLGDFLVSRIAYGGWAMGGHGWGKVDDNNSINAVRRALDLGINFFDTADVYGFGHSEEILGRALGDKRHDVVIATKFGVSWDSNGNIGRNSQASYVISALENSLKRLKIECIPLYQIHWPDPSTPISETMSALKKCQDQGKIKHIGVSNFSLQEINVAKQWGNIMSTQVPYSLIDRNIETNLAHHCTKNSIHMLTYGSLAKGLFSGKFSEDTIFKQDDIRSKDPSFKGVQFKKNLCLVKELRKIGLKYNKSSAQVALRWVLDVPGVLAAITGIKTQAQIEENVGALQWSLSCEDHEILSKLTGSHV
ncbi:MAG: aldo/keto reductase [Gammaproteobacteria bacterium]|nr:aldo/keto reductase [Gammaproteobacteria bacterium]